MSIRGYSETTPRQVRIAARLPIASASAAISHQHHSSGRPLARCNIAGHGTHGGAVGANKNRFKTTNPSRFCSVVLLTLRLQEPTSGHIGLSGIEHAFRKLARKLGIPDALKLYCARHTFGTVAMAETRNPGLVKEVMGHESLETTMGYCVHKDVM